MFEKKSRVLITTPGRIAAIFMGAEPAKLKIKTQWQRAARGCTFAFASQRFSQG